RVGCRGEPQPSGGLPRGRPSRRAGRGERGLAAVAGGLVLWSGRGVSRAGLPRRPDLHGHADRRGRTGSAATVPGDRAAGERAHGRAGGRRARGPGAAASPTRVTRGGGPGPRARSFAPATGG